VNISRIALYARRQGIDTDGAVTGDFPIQGSNGHAIFDALGAEEKELLWIEKIEPGRLRCNHFGQHPERLVGWFDRPLKNGFRDSAV
jgi:hypothetical protein